MSDEIEPGLSDRYRKASPWPVFVVLGFVVSEIGVLFGFFPVTVGGLLLFGGTVAGILSEAGYVDRAWRSVTAFGVVLAALGGLAVGVNLDPAAVSAAALLDTARPFVYRGTAIAAAGIVLVAVGATLRVAGRRPV